jgi:hypothetical protein
MNQNESFAENKDNILSFVTPENLECSVCAHVWDEFAKKFPAYSLSAVEYNTFSCYSGKYKLCNIIIDVDKDIVIKYNSNVYVIKKFSDISEFAISFEKYTEKLHELYTYLKKNYYLVYKNDMSVICIYGKIECSISCCSIEPTRKRKYYFGCDANNFLIYENDMIIKRFSSIAEMDLFSELQDCKNGCKFYCCCC